MGWRKFRPDLQRKTPTFTIRRPEPPDPRPAVEQTRATMRPNRGDTRACQEGDPRYRRSRIVCGLLGATIAGLMAATNPADQAMARDAADKPATAGETVPPPAPVWQKIFTRPSTIPAPMSNPLTPPRIALGKLLFADKRLSGNRDRACASCHRPDRAFTDGRRRALGRSGRPLSRNTPALWNLAWAPRLHWDGRFPSLEAQARAPIEHPDELAGDLNTIAARLNADPAMQQRFVEAFPATPRATPINLLRALASFTRTLISPRTRFDRWIAGDTAAINRDEYAGFRLFVGKAGCLACHGGWRMTNDRMHDIGLPGKAGAFKTPSLRLVERTAPYMHDGSLPTLTAVVDHYAERVEVRPALAPQLRQRAKLSAKERALLVAFLNTL